MARPDEPMDLGIGVTSGVDAQMLCADIFVSMALAAAHTSRTRLDTGVVIPSNRSAPVTASAWLVRQPAS